jgi:hypothetical protein
MAVTLRVGGAMAAPRRGAIQRYFDRYVEAWNAHDRDALLANWKSIATDVTMEDPVGSPIRRGWDDVVLGPWDLMNDTITVSLKELVICGSEVAFVFENVTDSFTVVSIETMRFEDDGAVSVRTYWEPQGEVLEGYAAHDPE